jgi:hypothetical protein
MILDGLSTNRKLSDCFRNIASLTLASLPSDLP